MPLENLRDWYQREHIGTCMSLGATGAHASAWCRSSWQVFPEDACYEAALALLPAGPLRLVNIGAHGYSVLVRDARGSRRFTRTRSARPEPRETMVRLARRLGLEIDEADRLASRATDAIPITARCSVFAKSELTHFANQGRPLDALLRGYFESIARYVLALAARGGDGGPIYVIGGVGRITAFVDAMRRQAGCPVIVRRSAVVRRRLPSTCSRRSPRAIPHEGERIVNPLRLFAPRHAAEPGRHQEDSRRTRDDRWAPGRTARPCGRARERRGRPGRSAP